MSSLRYPIWALIIATPAGWITAFLARMIFRLSNSSVAGLFAGLHKIMQAVAGDIALTQALSDLNSIFQEQGISADIYRKLITESRLEEIAYIIRGKIAQTLV